MTARLSGTPSKRPKKNGSGHYFIQNYIDEDGKRKQATGATAAQAVKNAEKKILGIEVPGKKAVKKSITFTAFAKRFIEDSTVGRDGRMPLDYDTLRVYESYLSNWVYPQIGGHQITELTRDHFTALRNHLVQNMPARSSALKAMTITRAIMSYAVECGLIPASPAAKVTVTLDWSEEEDRKEERIPSLADMRKIEETARECYHSENAGIARAYRRYYPFFLLLRTLGLRASECIGLQWGDFDDNMSRVNIRRRVAAPKSGLSEEDRVQRTKTKNGRRTIPVPPEIIPVLRHWKANCPRTDEGWMFPTRSGNPVSYYNMRDKFWTPLMKRAGVHGKGYGMHSMRHYFASTLIRQGRAKEAQTLLGHHSVAFTMDQYGHLFPDDATTMDKVRETVMDGMLV